ncbi:MAG: hypothetical protein GF316_04480 [Candidatus Lokiarchaeota archaeon]|nr:hypothetical protein [Candidatus Lokiarchaeota archaeon]
MKNIQEEMDKYITYFKKKKRFEFGDKEEINKILNSEKYFEFIDTVYNYYNSQINPDAQSKERLAIQCYLDADETINSFWIRLLGNNINDEIKNHLKITI